MGFEKTKFILVQLYINRDFGGKFKLRYSLKIKLTLFDVGFILYYLSFFIQDLAIQDTFYIVKILHYTSYLFLIAHLGKSKRKENTLLIFFITIAISAILAIFTHDIYWSIISLIAISSIDIDSRHIVKISFYILFIFVLLSFMALILGLLPNIVNSRSEETILRYGMGFYHSNVLPMIILYLMVYRILILGNRLKTIEIIFWIILSMLVYSACNSRNGLYGTIICALLYIFTKKTSISLIYHKILVFIAKYVIWICVLFSMTMVILQPYNISAIYNINNYFTGRFAIAYHQMRRGGLYFINTMNGEEYSSIANVLDNGYLYTILRYGVLFILFYIFIQQTLVKKYEKNNNVLVILISLVLTNMIDNDLYSYGFLPFIVLTFSQFPIIYKQSKLVHL